MIINEKFDVLFLGLLSHSDIVNNKSYLLKKNLKTTYSSAVAYNYMHYFFLFEPIYVQLINSMLQLVVTANCEYLYLENREHLVFHVNPGDI